MIFKIKQIVSHPAVRKTVEKESFIIGTDLRHAVSMVRADQGMKDQLLKKHWASRMDRNGRTLFIEITEELKA